MHPATARTIADALTWARIVSILPITALAVLGYQWWVFTTYIAAALTDLFDGIFARRATPPKNDVDLDGIADLVFSIATVVWIWLLVPGFVAKYWLPYLPIFLLLEAYMTNVRLRHQRYGVPHLEFGRWSMALFFTLLPALIVWGDVTWFVHSVLIAGVLSKLQLAWAFWNRGAGRQRAERADP